ncbi:IreB family regulatory phosphoprotein [Alicyclobacillus fodiniaquatilis]|uniref:IreB family regulatory phosphoprotein n=1 Tax=Alicyclobacillus fodiniaquatilis TaxID=1661150 RepID=A0ABW4JNP5_9BACL
MSEVAILNSYDFDKTILITKSENTQTQEAFRVAYYALKEKGYDPISQLVGYLNSGDPAYITNQIDARNTIHGIARGDLMNELVLATAALRFRGN